MEAQMLKKLMIKTAVSALMIGRALAQNSVPTGSTSPAATPPTAKSDKIAPASGGSAHFISVQKPDQWMASKFRGTAVVGADNKTVGSVNDILFDSEGKIEAYGISVGGFLGIGANDVALAPASFTVVPGDKTKNESDKLKLSMSADDLKQAANFEPYNPPRMTNRQNGMSNSAYRTPMNPIGSNRNGI
jgi:PRC-barrel domain